jgi:hypothetical protein
MRSRILLLPVLAVAATGCLAQALKVTPTENPEIKAELLFTHEGCRIFRFRDGNLPVYYADCSGGKAPSASVSWRRACGKNCSRPVLVTTAENPQPAR